MNAQSKVKQGASAKADRATRPTDQAPAGLGDTASVPSANTAIWDALGKTDPAHTKQFSRAGGFKGTAVKPMWVIRRLTEQFGPCGEGWGIGEPRFEVVHGAPGEQLVYCTVSCWHGTPENTLWGVGGDRVAAMRKDGKPFFDDEAFKKAFTDAVNNAFKFIGVAADIHMGQFDDSKYVAEVREEFAKTGEEPAKPREKLEGPYPSPTALKGAIKAFAQTLSGMTDFGEFNAWMETPDVVELEKQARRYLPEWWEDGIPDKPEFEPMLSRIERKKRELEELDSIANSPGAQMLRAG